MADPVSAYLIVLFVGIVLTVVVGVILARSVRPFLEDVFERRETAASVTRLVVVLFHLLVLGVVALVASINLDPSIQAIVVRLALVLLVLGAAYGGTLLLLTRLRARRRVQMLMDAQAAQAAQAEQARQTGQTQTYPVVEPGPGW